MDIINDFFNTGTINKQMLVTTIITLYSAGLVTYLFRDIPSHIWSWITRQLTTSLTITSKDEVFWYFQSLLFFKGISQHARKIRFSDARYYNAVKAAFNNDSDFFINQSEESLLDPVPNGPSSTLKVLGEGDHWLWFRHKLILFSVSIEKTQNSEYNSITLTKLGRSHAFFEEIKNEIDTVLKKEAEPNDKLSIYKYFSSYDNWALNNVIEKRSLESIFIDEEIKTKIINTISNFITNKKWYLDKGIPHNLGILLYGPPGTGKTSFIKAIASYFNRSIYYLDPKELANAEERLNNIKRPAIIVIEDIDSSFVVRARKDEEKDKKLGIKKMNPEMDYLNDIKHMELSGLLNTLDGLLGLEDRVMIMTTNHKEKLDKAFLRPGRIDLQIELGYIKPDIFNIFIKKFYDVDVGIKKIKQTTIAQLQNDYMVGLSYQQLIDKWEEK